MVPGKHMTGNVLDTFHDLRTDALAIYVAVLNTLRMVPACPCGAVSTGCDIEKALPGDACATPLAIGCPQPGHHWREPWPGWSRSRAAVTAHNPALPHLRRSLARQVLRDGTALALPVDGPPPSRRNGTRANSPDSTGAGSAPCGRPDPCGRGKMSS